MLPIYSLLSRGVGQKVIVFIKYLGVFEITIFSILPFDVFRFLSEYLLSIKETLHFFILAGFYINVVLLALSNVCLLFVKLRLFDLS